MMAIVHYHPGSWRAVVSPEGLALLPPAMASNALETIHAALTAGGGFAAVLQHLTDAFGSNLADIPPFAVVIFPGEESGGLRLAVRGALSIGVAGHDDESTFVMSGANITTWSERLTTGAESVRVWIEQADGDSAQSYVGSTTPDSGPERLRIISGIVPADDVVLLVMPAVRESTPRPAPDTPLFSEATAVAERASSFSEPTAVAERPSLPASAAPADSDSAEVPSASAVPDPNPVETPQATAPTAIETPPHSELDAEVESTRTDLPEEAYDHLWGETVTKSVESAAVREWDDDESNDDRVGSALSGATPVVPSPSEPPLSPQVAVEPPAAAPQHDTEHPALASPSAPETRSPADWTVPPATGLIDRVPDFSAIGAPAPPPAPALASAGSRAPTDASAPDVTAAPEPAAPDHSMTVPPTDPFGASDHDGLTVTVSEVEAMRRLADAALAAPAAQPISHARIVLSSGGTVAVDRTLVIGRRPRANRVDAATMPTLVTVPSPEHDISRNHLEIRTEGRHVLAVDLDTTNGSVLHRAGTSPARLTPLEPTLVVNGDVIDLGDGVTITFEDLA